MQVTHLEESDNHVIIGGGKSRAFSISTSPEFIEVLSSSLYSDKALAVVREVMCNAWDAHISAGITDKHIEVHISNNKLVIRDYGLGIPDDNIEDVYCTYGESTKRNELSTTGGFGLGSKAPFALSDTFKVTSQHNGIKSVYVVSKGSEATDNLPELRTIVTMPTTEQGLLVEIPLDGGIYQAAEILNLAKKVAYNGEMDAIIEYNGEIKINNSTDLGLKDAEANFLISSRNFNYRDHGNRECIYIQYGAVVYPLPQKEEYMQEYNRVAYILNREPRFKFMPAMKSGFLLIKAENSTLSVAPSRESLSYNKACISQIKALLVGVAEHFETTHPDLMKNAMDMIWDGFLETYKAEHGEVVTYNDVILFTTKARKTQSEGFNDCGKQMVNQLRDIHHFYLAPRYKAKVGFFNRYFYKKARKYIADLKNPRLFKLFNEVGLKLFKSQYTTDAVAYARNAYLVRDLYAKYGKDVFKAFDTRYNGYSGYNPVNIMEIQKYYYRDYEPFTVYLSNNISSIRRYMVNHRNLGYANCLVIHKTNKEMDIHAIGDWLEIQGYKVVRVYTMDQYQPAKRVPGATTKATVGKGTRTGYALLSETVNNNTGRLDYDRMFPEATRITDPEVVVSVSVTNHTKIVDHFRPEQILHLLKLAPKTVVVSNSRTESNVKYKFKIPSGREFMQKYIEAKILDAQFLNNVAFAQASVNGQETGMYKALANIPEIAQEFGLQGKGAPVTNDDHLLWKECSDFISSTLRYNFNQKVSTATQAMALTLPNNKLIEDREKFLRYIPLFKLNSFSTIDPVERKIILSMIQAILRG